MFTSAANKCEWHPAPCEVYFVASCEKCLRSSASLINTFEGISNGHVNQSEALYILTFFNNCSSCINAKQILLKQWQTYDIKIRCCIGIVEQCVKPKGLGILNLMREHSDVPSKRPMLKWPSLEISLFSLVSFSSSLAYQSKHPQAKSNGCQKTLALSSNTFQREVSQGRRLTLNPRTFWHDNPRTFRPDSVP